LSPHLLRSLLTEPDVVMPVPQTLLDRIDSSAVVQLKLAQLDAPIEPLGLLYRSGDDDNAVKTLLIDFLMEQAQGA
jgi:hypothetical protein